jgi:hypothetical protein
VALADQLNRFVRIARNSDQLASEGIAENPAEVEGELCLAPSVM